MSDPYLNRPEQPRLPPDIEREPLQADPMLNEGRAGPLWTTATLLGAVLVVMLMLYALNSRGPEQTASGPTVTPPAATNQSAPGNPGATGQGTTGQGSGPAINPARPQPQEQDPQEQQTRP